MFLTRSRKHLKLGKKVKLFLLLYVAIGFPRIASNMRQTTLSACQRCVFQTADRIVETILLSRQPTIYRIT